MEARFCGACGKALTPPGAPFCGACGAAQQASAPPPSPPTPPTQAPPPPQAYAPAPAYAPPPPPPPPAYAPPPLAAPAPAYASPAQAAPPSLAIAPDEVVLNKWSVNCAPPYGRLVVGKLTVTNRRVLFDPQTNAGGVLSMLFSFIGRADWKRRNTFVIDKSQIVHVATESSILGPSAVLQLADGLSIRFDRGVIMGVDDIVAAIQQR